MLCAAELLDISENGVRVAVTRLAQEGLIHAVERGVYQLREKKFDTSAVSLNKTANMQITATWDHRYILVYTGSLGRVDRSALSKREKALGYYGFQELEQNLFIRPDNLSLDLNTFKHAVIQFGLDPEARFFGVSEVENEAEIQKLWNIQQLNQNYIRTSQHIQAWFQTAEQLDLEHAAKSAFYLGKEALFTLRADTLLPTEWIDHAARHQFELDGRAMEQQGQWLWQQYFASHRI